ncbi:hypothetical protein SISNIDRAFT_411259 [Sistotremastrum niveocremeum HHB9708]|uniref:Metallo-beta-lactamase domain-containing protein n=1 Tax=Sistotremastrum niveocremeum HHB9708 TaxID=1314777 RepID=A0A164UH89_9AGAM|nr:hypothetical protein SISNIDRAFT_411259 [Sistotremastrum niveocremeum HHB9708]
MLEFIFSGTGTSSSLPLIGCLTAPSESRNCKTCLSTFEPAGKKNIRRNTGAIIRKHRDDPSQEPLVIAVDVGKTFLQSALEWFPKYGLRKIDAVVITHAHADAMNGLDDLRGWTLHAAIQKCIEIYVSQATFIEVNRSFPYLVSKEFASGGGDVPEFKWNIIDANVPFQIGSISILPFLVHHGRLFTDNAGVPAILPSPMNTLPPTPIGSGRSSPLSAVKASPIRPYTCFGFVFDDEICYMSDVSHIPEETWRILERKTYSMLVVDCLRITHHTSHFGIADAVETARRLGVQKSYLVGFGHTIPHDEWVTICEELHKRPEDRLPEHDSELIDAALAAVPVGNPIWMRPAYDGLRVFLDGDHICDDCDIGKH